ncbi:MAG TPA: helix-turn-helix transcriptional regulator [Gemmatimonadaceae bacterium]|nr:helix-turn-helix transcriptional regulator [Gemmatimonadaceae bacterium]
MSTNRDSRELDAIGVPELTALGKRIELLRIERRMSKGVLAQRAGTSRQQLWRVMTGKSELTSSLCARLADVLEVDSRILRDAERDREHALGVDPGPSPSRHLLLARAFDAARPIGNGHAAVPQFDTLEAYVSDARGLERTLQALPVGDDGRHLKRILLNAVEDMAHARALKLPAGFFDLRRRVVNDEF